ncbi:hypothetical protein COV61_00900 [Candidatus Micrarchaeota archaeon CG11_big_fil_rev_8_21_14_0_20_47_5]|nr:MAG: hypothetical protein AUJ17_03560 [Candidatus Micrarchaeota archaeon CG1_02_47_40]PIN84182.1 MAG: hypothetical protein COV61_00900 [Candidatus Micrarchaeota archaeon CG11_big_fil_rev_8_21_14_0_20_47_5]
MKKKTSRGFIFLDFCLAFLILLMTFIAYFNFISETSASAREQNARHSLLRRVSDAADYLIHAGLAEEGDGYFLSNELCAEKIARKAEIGDALAKRLGLRRLEIYIGEKQIPASQKNRLCISRLSLIDKNIKTLIVCGGIDDVI